MFLPGTQSDSVTLPVESFEKPFWVEYLLFLEEHDLHLHKEVGNTCGYPIGILGTKLDKPAAVQSPYCKVNTLSLLLITFLMTRGLLYQHYL